MKLIELSLSISTILFLVVVIMISYNIGIRDMKELAIKNGAAHIEKDYAGNSLFVWNKCECE